MVPLFGVSKHNPSKNREKGGALALGGRRSIELNNNQPNFGGSIRGNVIAEAGGGGEHGGVHRPIVWGGKWNYKKINNIKCIMAFGGPY